MQRRRFVTLLALGEALSSPLPLARRFPRSHAPDTRAARGRAPSAAVKREIETQEKVARGTAEDAPRYELLPEARWRSPSAAEAKRGVRR